MNGPVLLMLAAWVLLSLVGALVLAAVPPGLCAAFLPGVPLVGVAFLVVGLHATGLVLPVRYGFPVVAAGAVVLAAIGVRRRTAWPYATRSSALWTLAGILVALPFAVVALHPSVQVGDGHVLSPDANNDAFWPEFRSW